MSGEQFSLSILVGIARQAGKAILEIYDSDFEVIRKADGSPLTLADQNANAIIEHNRALTRYRTHRIRGIKATGSSGA